MTSVKDINEVSLRNSINDENLRRSSDLGIVGGQELDESHFDSRFFSVKRTASNDSIDRTIVSSADKHISGSSHNVVNNPLHEELDDYRSDNDDYDEDDHPEGHGNRIQFSTKKLYGRDRELLKLKDLYKSLMTDSRSPEAPASQVVHVTGYSGSGKTAVINEFIKQMKQEQESFPASSSSSPSRSSSMYIMHGKYEEPIQQKRRSDPTAVGASITGNAAPFKGISEAMESWYNSLTESNKASTRSYMQKHFQQGVGDDINVLFDIVPCLKHLVLDTDQAANVPSDSVMSKVHVTDDAMNKSRVHFVFQTFFKCLCQQQRQELEDRYSLPIIFVFEDVQWADVQSLDLLLSILASDPSCIGNSLVILSTRSNEIEEEDHPVNERLLHPIGKLNDGKDNVHTMEISNLKQNDIGEFIADTLQLDVDEVSTLTEAIYTRTLGNIFFTMQAMEQLYRQNALYYDMVMFHWKWLLSKEELQDELSHNIVDMVRSKIKCLTNDIQQVLAVFSHTRSTLDVDTLLELVNATTNLHEETKPDDINNNCCDKQRFLSILNKAVEEGLLTKSEDQEQTKPKSNTGYSFAHDRIREAARSFWVGDTLHKKLFRLGNALVLRGSEYKAGEEWMLVTAVQHLNSVPVRYHDDRGKISLSRLNLETAKLSMSRAAFEDAAKYAEKGIHYLPQDRWESQGALSHELYALAAESSRLVGHIAQMQLYCTTCLTAEKHRLPVTKADVYYTLARGVMYGPGRFKDAKDIVLEVLKHLGCPFPTSAIGAKAKTVTRLLGLIITKRKRSADDVEKMDFMTNETVVKTMKLLDLLFDICYLTNDEVLIPLIMFKALEYTLNYGVSIYSPRLIASMCVIFTGVLDSLQDGKKHAEYAVKLMKKVNHKPIEAGTMLCVYIFGLHWLMPTLDCVPPLREAYKIGMNTGQVENGCWCISLALLLLFQSGTPLPVVDEQMKLYISRMEEVGQTMIAMCTKVIWGAVVGIMDSPKDKVGLTKAELELENPLMKVSLDAFARIEHAYLGDYEKCANSAVEDANQVVKAMPGNPTPPFDVFLSSLSCFEMARRKPNNPAYLKEARLRRKCIARWAKQGSPNYQHRNALLDAEFAVIQRNNKLAVRKFQLAVDLALKGKFTNDAAVANERWGTFALEVLHDEVDARRRLTDAIDLCTRWGAVGKIRRLKERFPTVLQQKQLSV